MFGRITARIPLAFLVSSELSQSASEDVSLNVLQDLFSEAPFLSFFHPVSIWTSFFLFLRSAFNPTPMVWLMGFSSMYGYMNGKREAGFFPFLF